MAFLRLFSERVAWTTFIMLLTSDIDLNWVMIANSLTVKSHPRELVSFVGQLQKKNIEVINSAVFNGGFLTGGDFYNYQQVDAKAAYGKALLEWRKEFFMVCERFGVLPAEAVKAQVNRAKVNFDFSWQFYKGDIAMEKVIKAGGQAGLTDVNVKIVTAKDTVINYNAVKSGTILYSADWKAVNLPHDWAIEGSFVHDI